MEKEAVCIFTLTLRCIGPEKPQLCRLHPLRSQAARPRVLQSLVLQAPMLRMLKDAANRSTPIMRKLASGRKGEAVVKMGAQRGRLPGDCV